jgi:hypothetical protein
MQPCIECIRKRQESRAIAECKNRTHPLRRFDKANDIEVRGAVSQPFHVEIFEAEIVCRLPGELVRRKRERFGESGVRSARMRLRERLLNPIRIQRNSKLGRCVHFHLFDRLALAY